MSQFRIKPLAFCFASANLLVLVAGTAYAAAQPQSCATESLVYSFDDSTLRSPRISLGADGGIYIAEPSGGVNTTGRIMRITPAGQLSVLHDFAAPDPNAPSWLWVNTDGISPDAAPIVASDGNLYGTAEFGGANGQGAIYRIAADGSFTLLHEFSAGDDGNSYVNADGERPVAALTDGGDGYLYGAAFEGGTNGEGTVFRFKSNGAMTVLYNFGSFNSGDVGPENPLVRGGDGNFYGMHSSTTLFRITPEGQATDLHTIARQPDGCTQCDLISGVVAGADGNLVGTTQGIGEGTYGGLFSLSTSGDFSSLYDFAPPARTRNRQGANPVVAPILGHDGNFYGAAYDGGPNGTGTIYRMTPSGRVSVVYHFAAAPRASNYVNATGANPGGLVQTADGSFYGITEYGGSNGYGAIFKLSLARCAQ